MERFIKIPKEVAESIDRFEYFIKDRICQFDPFCSEQKDGCYLMDEKTYLLIKDIPEVKLQFDKVDLTLLERITEDQIDLKEDIK